MTRENVLFLVGGLAFGILIGFGTYHAYQSSPSLAHAPVEEGNVPAPQGPPAPTQRAPASIEQLLSPEDPLTQAVVSGARLADISTLLLVESGGRP